MKSEEAPLCEISLVSFSYLPTRREYREVVNMTRQITMSRIIAQREAVRPVKCNDSCVLRERKRSLPFQCVLDSI
jgi:hypothetical protein